MSTADKIALAGVLIAAFAGGIPLLLWWLSKRDEKYKIVASLNPYVFIDPTGKPLLHGMAVSITCLSKEPAEIVSVRLRRSGIDLTSEMVAGWSTMKRVTPSKLAKPEDSGIEIQMRLEHDRRLVVNSNQLSGAVLRKNKSLTFFTPLPLHPPGIQRIFDTAQETDLSIVGHILPDKNRVLIGVREIKSTMKASLKAYGDKPADPSYPWHFTTFTLAELPSDTAGVGTLNDRPIMLKVEEPKQP